MAAPCVGEKGESTQKYNHGIEVTSLELPAARYHNPVLSWIAIKYHHRNNVSQKWDGGHKLAISMRPLGMKTLPLDIFSGIFFYCISHLELLLELEGNIIFIMFCFWIFSWFMRWLMSARSLDVKVETCWRLQWYSSCQLLSLFLFLKHTLLTPRNV